MRGSSTGYLEITSEAQRGQSHLRKQTESFLVFPPVTEAAEELPCTVVTGNSDGAVCGCSRVRCLPAPALVALELENPAVEVNGANPSLS